MFTATWPKEVRELANNFMNSPVKVTVGDRDELSANKRITQVVEVINKFDKEKKLIQLLRKYNANESSDNKILIFALYKRKLQELKIS